MSFINLFSNDVWTDADITNRTEAMVRSIMPLQEELVLNRKMQGANLGEYTLTEKDQNDILKLKEIGLIAQQEGIDARNDMALLLKVFDLESAHTRLNLPVVEPEYDEDENVTNQEQIDIDLEERSVAQEVVDSATEEEQELYLLRNPVVEEVAPDEEIVIDEEII